MDDFGHFRLFPDHQLCPICSTRHHPFCTHSSRFTSDNLRLFPSEIRPPHFERPYYLSHPPPFPAPLPSGPVPFRPSFYPPSFHHEELRERDIFRKRMRVEDQAIGVFPPFETFDRTLSVENERMLNLVRSHGREGISQGHGEHYRNNNIDYRMDRDNIDHDVEQKYIFNRGIDPGFPEPNFHHRKAYSHFNACEGYRNQSMPSLDREDIFMPRERGGFDRVKSETDSRGMFDPEIGDCYPYGQIVQFEKNYPVHGFQRSDKVLGGSEDILSSVQQRSFQKDLLMVSYSSNEDNPVRVGTFQDQQLFQTMPSTSYLLPIASFTSEPCHQEDAIQKEMERKSDFYTQQEEARRTSQNWPPNPSENRRPLDPLAYPIAEQLRLHTNKQSGYAPVAAKANHAMPTSIPDIGHTSQTYPPTPPQSLFADVNPVIGTFIPDQGHSSHTYPPVPSQPLFPIQTELSSPCLHTKSSVSKMISVASPSRVNTSANRHLSSHESQSLPQGELYLVPLVHAPNGFATEGSPFIHQSSSKSDEEQLSVPAKQPLKEKLAYVDASHLFKQPYRASRPDHIVIILRGLPGSGKSYLAKALRDIEVENGGSAPRIHAMDDYFMMEVEKKVDDNDGFKSSGSVRSKKQITKKVIEYCYEPELEEAYRSSMLKAFKKTLDDGIFTLVIVDDRNLRVADFAQFWALSKRPGYEVYLLEAAYKDPVGCAARNIHGFKLDDIQKMAKRWEEAPPLYLHLDIQSLFSGNDLIDQSIQEVDMDADDTTGDGEAHHLEEADGWNSTEQNSLDLENNNGSIKLGKRWNTEEAEVNPEKKDLQKSKWSKNLSANLHDSNNSQENTNALSGLIQTYGKDAKFVHWGDKLETSGFCIGASKKHYASSLIIGPGAGYNLKSNPLPEENIVEEAMGKISNETKKRFSEKLRAESESFRAVFDRRRRRVVGLWDAEDE